MREAVTKIICPYCGQEYLPAEIFIPKSFIGVPSNIEKSFDGKILDYDGDSMNLKESYRCDRCDKLFYVDAQVKFQVSKPDNKYNFDEEYSSKLKTKKYSLFEN